MEGGEDDGGGDQDNLNEECEDQPGGEDGEGGSEDTEQQGEPAGELQTDQGDIQVKFRSVQRSVSVSPLQSVLSGSGRLSTMKK